MNINDFAARLKAVHKVEDDLLRAVAKLCHKENVAQVREAGDKHMAAWAEW